MSQYFKDSKGEELYIIELLEVSKFKEFTSEDSHVNIKARYENWSNVYKVYRSEYAIDDICKSVCTLYDEKIYIIRHIYPSEINTKIYDYNTFDKLTDFTKLFNFKDCTFHSASIIEFEDIYNVNKEKLISEISVMYKNGVDVYSGNISTVLQKRMNDSIELIKNTDKKSSIDGYYFRDYDDNKFFVVELTEIYGFKDIISDNNDVSIVVNYNKNHIKRYKVYESDINTNDICESLSYIYKENGMFDNRMYVVEYVHPSDIKDPDNVYELKRIRRIDKIFNYIDQIIRESTLELKNIYNINQRQCITKIHEMYNYDEYGNTSHMRGSSISDMYHDIALIKNTVYAEVNNMTNDIKYEYIPGMQTATFYNIGSGEFSHRAIISPELLINKFLKMCVKFKDDKWYYIDTIVDINEEDFNRFSPLPHIEVYSTEDNIKELDFISVLEYNPLLEEIFSLHVHIKLELMDKMKDISDDNTIDDIKHKYIPGMHLVTFYDSESKTFSHRAIITKELLINKFLNNCISAQNIRWSYVYAILDIDEKYFNRILKPDAKIYSTEDDIKELTFISLYDLNINHDIQIGEENVRDQFVMIRHLEAIDDEVSKKEKEDADYIYFKAYELSKLLSKQDSGEWTEYMCPNVKPTFKIRKDLDLSKKLYNSIFKIGDKLYLYAGIIPCNNKACDISNKAVAQYTCEKYTHEYDEDDDESNSIINIKNMKADDIEYLMKDMPMGIEYKSDDNGNVKAYIPDGHINIIRHTGSHDTFAHEYDGDTINTLKFNFDEDKNIKTIKEDNDMSNTQKTGMNLTTINSNLYIGPYQNPNVTVSAYGLAIYNKTTEQWIAYNGQDTIDVSNFIISGMNMPIFALPVQIDKIKVGDIILHNGEVVVVNELKTGYKPTDNEDVTEEEPNLTSSKPRKKPTKKQYTKSVEVLNISKSEIRQVLPVKNPFGFDICTKLCIPFSMDNFGANMGEGMFNEKSLMAMCMFGGGMNMFGNMNGENNGQDNNIMGQMMQTSMMMKMMGGMNIF